MNNLDCLLENFTAYLEGMYHSALFDYFNLKDEITRERMELKKRVIEELLRDAEYELKSVREKFNYLVAPGRSPLGRRYADEAYERVKELRSVVEWLKGELRGMENRVKVVFTIKDMEPSPVFKELVEKYLKGN